MSKRPDVLLIDDGELDDVARVLGELGQEPVRLGGAECYGEWTWPSKLLVATARTGLALGPFTGRDKAGCTTIAVTEDDSKTVQSVVRRMGFDYLVRRPIHPEALRLLVLRALYGDRERRGEPRLPLGYTVTWRSGWRKRTAMVAEISAGGCRLLTNCQLGAGSRVSVRIPRELVGGTGLSLPGRTVRCEPRASAGGAKWLLGVAFDDLSERAARRLDQLLRRYSIGPPRLPGRDAAAFTPSAPAPAAPVKRPWADTPTVEILPDPLAAEPEAEPKWPEEAEAAAESDADPLLPVESSSEALPEDQARAERAEDTPSFEEEDGEFPAPPADAHADDPRPERRRPRAVFSQEVLALDQRADSVLHVLVGRDISTGGVRIEAHPALVVGDRLRLAIYDSSAKEPFIVHARADRDDAGAGLGLRFLDVDPEVLKQLDAVVESLPAVEALRPAECEPRGVVLAEILDSDEDEGS